MTKDYDKFENEMKDEKTWETKTDFDLKNKRFFDILVKDILDKNDEKTLVYIYSPHSNGTRTKYLIKLITKIKVIGETKKKKGNLSFEDYGDIAELIGKKITICNLRLNPNCKIIYDKNGKYKKYKVDVKKDREYLKKHYEKNFGDTKFDYVIFFKIENKKYLDILLKDVKSPNKIVFF